MQCAAKPLASVGKSLAMAAVLFVAACGLGSGPPAGEPDPITDPIVAATVDGRPIYVEDVRSQAVRRGLIPDGQSLDPADEAFGLALDELIEQRLFSQEAERRGLDRDPEIRRQLELARERVLAAAIYRELDDEARDPNRIAEVYRESQSQLAGRPQVRLRHILAPTREAAQAIQRRLQDGESFADVAFEMSLDRESATEGGYLGEILVDDLEPAFRDLAASLPVGGVGGPIQSQDGWHLVMVEARDQSQAPSMETLREPIIRFLLRQEVDELYARLAAEAQIVTVSADDSGLDPSESGAEEPDSAPSEAPPPERTAPIGPGALAAGADAPTTAEDVLPADALPPRSSPPPAVARPPEIAPQGATETPPRRVRVQTPPAQQPPPPPADAAPIVISPNRPPYSLPEGATDVPETPPEDPTSGPDQ
jgi:peptidyl-prolyl cis-trans isomerase C